METLEQISPPDDEIHKYVRITHPDYEFYKPTTELERAQQDVISIMYRWDILVNHGMHLSAQGETIRNIDSECGLEKDDELHPIHRMTRNRNEMDQLRGTAQKDLDRLFEIEGVRGGNMLLTMNSEYTDDTKLADPKDVQSVEITGVGAILVRYNDDRDTDREALIVTNLGTRGGNDIRFI